MNFADVLNLTAVWLGVIFVASCLSEPRGPWSHNFLAERCEHRKPGNMTVAGRFRRGYDTRELELQKVLVARSHIVGILK